MRIKGAIKQDGEAVIIEIPAINGLTEAHSRADVLPMAEDYVINDVAGLEEPLNMHAKAVWTSDTTFEVTTDFPERLVARVLRALRIKSGLTLMEVAKRLGSNSPNAYGRFEQGKTTPTITKFDELLRAVGSEVSL